MKEIIKIVLFVAVVIGVVVGSEFLASKIFQTKYPQAVFGEFIRLVAIILMYWFFNKYFIGTEFFKTNLITDFHDVKWMPKGLFMGAILIFSTYTISYLTKAINIHVSIENTNDFVIYVGVLLITMVCTAIWEEVVFRGVVLGNLSKVIGPNLGSIVVALIFGLMHLLSPIKSWQMVLSTVFAGLLLNYAFLNSRNIWFAISIHFSWNFFNSLLYSKKFMGIEYVKPALAGNKNPEEGIIAIVVT